MRSAEAATPGRPITRRIVSAAEAAALAAEIADWRGWQVAGLVQSDLEGWKVATRSPDGDPRLVASVEEWRFLQRSRTKTQRVQLALF